MKIAVISNEQNVGRKFIYSNLEEVLTDSQTMECVSFENIETSINEADYLVLVSHNSTDSIAALEVLIDQVELSGKAYGVLFNKIETSDTRMKDYCKQNQITLLEELAFDEGLVKSQGTDLVVTRENEDYRIKFLTILNRIYIHMANMIYKIKVEDSNCSDH